MTKSTSFEDEDRDDYETLAARYRPLFQSIAERAVERETKCELPFAEVSALLQAGFGALRLPKAQGGAGVSLLHFFRLLVELGEADSNLVQIFRAHAGFVEGALTEYPDAVRDRWLAEIAAGALIGAAMSERSAVGDIRIGLVREDGRWRLNGSKFYSTGGLYAHWLHVIAADGDDLVFLAVPANAEGVERIDDWRGFGQRLTASGTTRFDNVLVPDDDILRRAPLKEFIAADTYILAFYQQVHLAALAGIGRAALRDAVSFTQKRTRVFSSPGRAGRRRIRSFSASSGASPAFHSRWTASSTPCRRS